MRARVRERRPALRGWKSYGGGPMHGLFMQRMASHAVALVFVAIVLSGIVASTGHTVAGAPRLKTPDRELSGSA
jgi:hypothetical protein